MGRHAQWTLVGVAEKLPGVYVGVPLLGGWDPVSGGLHGRADWAAARAHSRALHQRHVTAGRCVRGPHLSGLYETTHSDRLWLSLTCLLATHFCFL